MRSIPIALLLLAGIAAGQDNVAKTYPENGTVIAIHVGGPTNNVRYSVEYPSHVYRIETPTRFYELMDKGKKPSLALEESVEFRIEKENAYVWNGKKEKRYNLTDVEEKTGATSKPN
jgi:hypothetical protein